MTKKQIIEELEAIAESIEASAKHVKEPAIDRIALFAIARQAREDAKFLKKEKIKN